MYGVGFEYTDFDPRLMLHLKQESLCLMASGQADYSRPDSLVQFTSM